MTKFTAIVNKVDYLLSVLSAANDASLSVVTPETSVTEKQTTLITLSFASVAASRSKEIMKNVVIKMFQERDYIVLLKVPEKKSYALVVPTILHSMCVYCTTSKIQ